jgi:hypothetical protein
MKIRAPILPICFKFSVKNTKSKVLGANHSLAPFSVIHTTKSVSYVTGIEIPEQE